LGTKREGGGKKYRNCYKWFLTTSIDVKNEHKKE